MAKQSLYVTSTGTGLLDWCERQRTVIRLGISHMEAGQMSVTWRTPGKDPIDITAKTIENDKRRLTELDAFLKSRASE